jgi:hypothetical protein
LGEALGVALDREDRDISRRALQYLVRDSFGTRERRNEIYIDSVLAFPFCGERGIDVLLERLLHD